MVCCRGLQVSLRVVSFERRTLNLPKIINSSSTKTKFLTALLDIQNKKNPTIKSSLKSSLSVEIINKEYYSIINTGRMTRQLYNINNTNILDLAIASEKKAFRFNTKEVTTAIFTIHMTFEDFFI